LALLFLQAYMHNLNLVYILLFFLLAFALASWGLARENLRPVRCRAVGQGRLFAGEAGEVWLELERLKRGESWGLRWRLAEGMTPVAPLSYGRPVRTLQRRVPPRRGSWKPAPCRIESRFPLGLFEATRPVVLPCEFLVYPRPRGASLKALLQRRKSPVGEERDFDGLRRYSGAESLSRIHWPSVAKGETAVKTFVREEARGPLVLEYAEAGEDRESSLEQLTLWVLECERTGRSFELRLPHRSVRSAEEGIDGILEILARY